MFYAIVKFNFLAERLSPQNMQDLKETSDRISQTMRISTMWVDEDQLDDGMCSLCFSIFAVSTKELNQKIEDIGFQVCLLYTSPSPRDRTRSRMPSSA